MALRAPVESQSTALVRFDAERPKGLFGRLRGAMEKWTLQQGGKDLEARLARLVAPQNEYGVDPFGLDLEFAKAAIAPALWLYKNWFRVETHGIEHVPAGRALIIANHSGQLPFDALMIGISMLVEAEPPRICRAMVEKWAPTLPFVAPFFARIGQVVGTPENARRLLAAGETLMVFPEGTRGLNKTFEKKYQLQDFGLGFMRLALQMQAPIVPVAVVGAEEQAPALWDFKAAAKIFGFPSLPVTPTVLPLPLPVKYRLHFGAPMKFTGSADDDDAELERKVKDVKARVQAMVNRGVEERKAIFF
ncbi:MAG: lysophospholipid acyltransferase family protein [Myxococcales bacterium]